MNAQPQIEAISLYQIVRGRRVDLIPREAATQQRPGHESWQTAARGAYLRSKPELPPEAIADLEEYFKHLRDYYGIPDSEPVFPPIPEKYRATQVPKASRKATGKNRNDHPWRTT
jgi:hypothetical protein